MPLRGFEEAVLPHLDAAFNYARWLTKSRRIAVLRRRSTLRMGKDREAMLYP